MHIQENKCLPQIMKPWPAFRLRFCGVRTKTCEAFHVYHLPPKSTRNMPTQFFNMQQQGWLLLALINCIFLVNGDNTFLNFFNPSLSTAPHFTGSAFHNVSLNLDVEGSIAAYGDFNNDK